MSAHRHGLDRREAGLAGGQAVDEAEPDRRDGDADRVGGEPSPARLTSGRRSARGASAQRRNVLAQVPSQTTIDRVLLGRVARRVEQARAALRRALPDPPALVVVERRRLGRERRGQARRAPRRAPRSPRRARPRSRSCTGSSGRRSRSRGPSCSALGGRRPVAASCERCPPPAPRSIAHGSHAAAGAHQTAGRPVAARVGRGRQRPVGGRRSAVDELDRVLVAEVAVERRADRHRDGRAPASASATPGAWRGSRRTSTGGAKWSAGSTNQRGAATAVRTSTPPSTSADTSWAWTCGWASPPIDPATTHGPATAVTEQHPGEQRVERPLAAARGRWGGPGRG